MFLCAFNSYLIISAITTMPTKGVILKDKVTCNFEKNKYRIDYEQVSAGTSGSGLYLLPIRKNRRHYYPRGTELQGDITIHAYGKDYKAYPFVYDDRFVGLNIPEMKCRWSSYCLSLSQTSYAIRGWFKIAKKDK